MSDDLDYLRARIPNYRAYGDEAARHDSDMRVRAFVGERLSEAQTRLGDGLAGATKETFEAVLMRCMFTDQVFVHGFEHAVLDADMLDRLAQADRALVELAEQLSAVTIGELPGELQAIDAQFDRRRKVLSVAT